MTNKTYNQYCAIANALDAVGERWTLLVVRNLLLGPKRFSDLLKGLPGISTNILTDRLKLLEENAVVSTRYLPPPAASTVYQLTESGQALAEALSALARWGSVRLGVPDDDQVIVSEGIGFMVIGVFYRRDQPDFTLTCAFRVTHPRYDHTFGIGITPQGVSLDDEPPAAPDVTLTIALEDLPALSSARARLADLIASGAVQVSGKADRLIAWVDGRA